MTKTAQQILAEAEARQIRIDRARIIADQIGVGNLMAISGTRVIATEKGVALPVSNGYRVEVDLDEGSDSYTVRRVFARAGQTWTKGEVTGVYCEQMGDLAYYASCFRSYDEHTWMEQG